jgi:hypothetical protein
LKEATPSSWSVDRGRAVVLNPQRH